MNAYRPMFCWLALLLPVAACADNFDPLSGSGVVARSQLSSAYLLNTATDPGSLIDFAAYSVPENAAHPRNFFQGTLTLASPATKGGFQAIVDTHGYTGLPDTTRKHLPPFSFQFIQTGSHIFPLQRGSIAGSHPEWEYVLAPGRVWNEDGDAGYSRAAIPFALQQKNANCVHNGVMTFLFKTDGRVSKVAYQIASETRSYFKVNMWGVLDATYAPQTIANAAALISAYQAEMANRMPTKPLSALASDFPSAGIDIAKLAAPDGNVASEITGVGFVTDGVHYTGACVTRYGAFPYCSSLILPSYSTAKSVFAGAAMMRLEKKYPGTRSLLITSYVPACNTAAWNDVTLEDTLDMATGNYNSASYEADERARSTYGLFGALTHSRKIDYSCNTYPRRAAPGTTWVCHTSDTYVAGTMMNAYLKTREGSAKDLYTDLVAGELWAPLKTSPTSLYTRRTYDSVAQPFTGWGLIYLPDDVAKIASFMGIDHGAANGTQLLDAALLDDALQLDANDRGPVPLKNYHYNNGLWAYNVKSALSCAHDTYVPFMSGSGGITVLLMQNDTVYYLFSDSNTYAWLDAARESNKIRPLCR
jgi:hypothetical protein